MASKGRKHIYGGGPSPALWKKMQKPRPEELLECVHAADALVKGKRYRALPTTTKEDVAKMVRVIDDSGEDYLYPRSYFKL